MPNWCSNTVKIKSNPNFTYLLKSRINEDSVIEPFFKKTLNIDHSNSNDWYNCNCIDIWCKWDMDVHITFDNDLIYLSFDSAWSPPINGLIELAKTYMLNLEFDYDEPGMMFIGKGSIDHKGNIEDSVWQDNDYLSGLYHVNGIEAIYDFIEFSYCDDLESFLYDYADDLSQADFNDLKFALINQDNSTVIDKLNL